MQARRCGGLHRVTKPVVVPASPMGRRSSPGAALPQHARASITAAARHPRQAGQRSGGWYPPDSSTVSRGNSTDAASHRTPDLRQRVSDRSPATAPVPLGGRCLHGHQVPSKTSSIAVRGSSVKSCRPCRTSLGSGHCSLCDSVSSLQYWSITDRGRNEWGVVGNRQRRRNSPAMTTSCSACGAVRRCVPGVQRSRSPPSGWESSGAVPVE